MGPSPIPIATIPTPGIPLRFFFFFTLTLVVLTSIISPEVIPTIHNHIAPNDDPLTLVSEINDWNEDTLITSHLPFVPNLVTTLTGQDVFLSNISFETGTVVCLERGNQATWIINWAASPSSPSPSQ
jgi:phosphohistidine phosphatase SixA